MKLEDLVPPLELCQKIPAGRFEDCAFCWHYTDVVGFVCRTSGCEEVQGKQWQIVNNHRRKIEIRRKHGEEIYPAPTLQEILEELHKQQEDVFLKWSETAYNEWVVNAYTHNKEDYQAHDNNPATAALKVWLKHKRIEVISNEKGKGRRMATVTISYKSLPLKMRLCFKPYKKADGTHELRLRWWYALYFCIKFAFNVRFEAIEESEESESKE